ncbi:MAG: cadherin repeat domain-containing protein, partial [Fidelibacterota bacterium]
MKNYKKYTYRSGMAISPLILSACGGSTLLSNSAPIDDQFDIFNINLPSEITVAENSNFKFQAPQITDGVPLGEITYSISGLDSDQFSVNIKSGVVSLESQDFENMVDADQNNSYVIELTATDQRGTTATKIIEVNVKDVIEIANFQLNGQGEHSVLENHSFTGNTPQVAGEVPIGTLTYSMSGVDADLFEIDPSTGVVKLSSQDFENASDDGENNIYNYTITATDSDENASVQDFSLAVQDQAFVIEANESIKIAENDNFTSESPTMAGDAPIGSVTYSISGADASKFVINSSTGIVTMNAKNYENATDVGTNNIYDYTINATDEAGKVATKDISVEVEDANEVANFTIDNSLGNSSVGENSHYTSSTPLTTGDTPIGNLTYSLSGADATKFVTNSSTGVVTMTAKDYENATDVGTNNIYNYTINATDEDGNIASKDISIEVGDVSEVANFTIDDSLGSSSVSENSNYTSSTPSTTGDTPIGNLTYSLSGADATKFVTNSST